LAENCLVELNRHQAAFHGPGGAVVGPSAARSRIVDLLLTADILDRLEDLALVYDSGMSRAAGDRTLGAPARSDDDEPALG